MASNRILLGGIKMVYAQLNEDKICIAITHPYAEISADNLIETQTLDSDYLNRKYENNTWSEIKFDVKTNVPADAIELLKQENLDLKLAVAELMEVVVGG